MSEEKKCWACHKTLVGGEKFGLCSNCINKYGSPVAAIGLTGLAIGGRFIIKNGGKIMKASIKIINH